jgi:hypothetical protein
VFTVDLQGGPGTNSTTRLLEANHVERCFGRVALERRHEPRSKR